tara:strand:- start:10731 stop:11177 length:447 start_codon:yes stop_codon:yes gene_type:complete
VIDILKDATPAQEKQKVAKPSVGVNLLLAGALAFVVYDTRYWQQFIPSVVPQNASQVLFVVNDEMSAGQGQASISMKVDQFCEQSGVERRRLEVGQDTTGAETWLQEMAEIGYGQAPSLVFRSKSGQLDCIPLPNSIDAAISEIRSRL